MKGHKTRPTDNSKHTYTKIVVSKHPSPEVHGEMLIPGDAQDEFGTSGHMRWQGSSTQGYQGHVQRTQETT